MSRTYRIRLKEALSETVSVNEAWSSRVQVLPLLSKEEMGKLVSEELSALGWETISDHEVKCSNEDWETVFNSITLQLRTECDMEHDVVASVDTVVDSYAHDDTEETAWENAKKHVDSLLKDELSEKVEKAKQESLERMQSEQELVFDDIKSQIESCVQKAQIRALKTKAARLGEIESVTEQDGEVTIKIKV